MDTMTGQIHIADDVLATIASSAVLETEGAVCITSHFRRKKQTKGVILRVEDGKVSISIDISVKSGVIIQEVACDVQQKIKSAVETMTGHEVSEVNVNVTGLVA